MKIQEFLDSVVREGVEMTAQEQSEQDARDKRIAQIKADVKSGKLGDIAARSMIMREIMSILR